MVIQQLYTSCLSQGAYYIESGGEVAIIDPLRESEPYLKMVQERGSTIKYIFETHFHADFVSGHINLQAKTGAKIIFGPLAAPAYDVYQAADGEVFKLGEVTIEVLHTPGHTMESTCYLLRDKAGKPHALFTGDTLLLGDVGRPDLAQKAADMTKEDLAGILFDSLRNKIMPLPDHVIIYPAHGAGSACGKNMMKETVDTLGNQKKMNYALRENMSREEFINEVTEGLMPPPAYFPSNVQLNKQGYDIRQENKLDRISPSRLKQLTTNEGVIVLDVRHKDAFKENHIPGSLYIGLSGSFAPWVGVLVKDIKTQIILVCEDNKVEEAITRLARVGFDQVIGILDGGIEKWMEDGNAVEQVNTIDISELDDPMRSQDATIIDVRRCSEFANGHIDNAINKSLSDIYKELSTYTPNEKYIIHCQSGYRSVIAASILKANGIQNITDLTGGYLAYLNHEASKIKDSVKA